jgi:hypothetical protein
MTVRSLMDIPSIILPLSGWNLVCLRLLYIPRERARVVL